MLVFHGSKTAFNYFDPKYFGSGEGAGAFQGWYFSGSLKGAYHHTESYLRGIDAPGYIYVCNLPKEIAILDCENDFTDFCYHGPAVGAKLIDSNKIEIIERLPIRELLPEVLGDPIAYRIGDKKLPLKGGTLSLLRRVDDGSAFNGYNPDIS